MRTGKTNRTVDVVVWPSCHDDVERIVKAASRHNVCLIPFGGQNNTLHKQCSVTIKTMYCSGLMLLYIVCIHVVGNYSITLVLVGI